MKYLYRGANIDFYNKLEGKLVPKKPGKDFCSAASMGAPHAYMGSGIIMGASTLNTAILHQLKQKAYPTSGISFTPFLERAKFYATCGGTCDGVIYKIDISKVAKFGISVISVNANITYPSIPEDDEHILVAKDFGEIPLDLVEKVISISSKLTIS